MRKSTRTNFLTLLILLVCTTIKAQEKNEASIIKSDITGMVKSLKNNDAAKLYTYFPSEKTIKEIFLLSEDNNYEKIKSRYGYHLNVQKEDFLKTIIKKVSSDFSSYKIIISYYQRPSKHQFSKAIISTIISINNRCYELELLMLKLEDSYYYLPKEELQKTKESCIELLTKAKNRKLNDNEVFIIYDSNTTENNSKPIPFVLTDIEPTIGKCNLESNNAICFKKAIETIISEGLLKLESNKNDNSVKSKRVFISFTINKLGKIENVTSNNVNTKLKKNITDILLKVDGITPAQNGGITVKSLFTAPITINIK